MAYTRKRHRKQKLPISQRTFISIVSSCVEIGILFLGLLLSAMGITVGARIFSVLGIISVIGAFAAIIISVRELLDPAYNLISRIVGVALPVVAFIMWIVIYTIGFASIS